MESCNKLWIDLETTGTDESVDQILEFCVALANDSRDGDFQVMLIESGLVLPPNPIVMCDYVREMHAKNGLLEELETCQDFYLRNRFVKALPEKPLYALGDADVVLRNIADDWFPWDEKVELAGGSVHFDLKFCRRHLPRFSERLSHRVFDTSTLKTAARLWGPGFESIKGDVHRAKPDVLDSIAEAKALRDLIGWQR